MRTPRLIVAALVFAPSLFAIPTTPVTSNADNATSPAAGTLRYAINQVNASPGTYDSIDMSAIAGQTITLAQGLFINAGTGNPLALTGLSSGNTVTIDGASLYRGFLVYSGNVSLSFLNFQNCYATGGTGGAGGNGSGGSNQTACGGGGAGLGGGLYINGGGSVTGNTLTFTNCRAIGGTGGGPGAVTSAAGGGGGGMGGNGGAGNTDSGGGGGGIFSSATGGAGFSGTDSSSFGGGGGGIFGAGSAGSAGGGGGSDGGGAGGSFASNNGVSPGTFGGGGGSSVNAATNYGVGANGAFGGGGGGGGGGTNGTTTYGAGVGGFGGGGGGAALLSQSGSSGAGNAGPGGYGGGGGGTFWAGGALPTFAVGGYGGGNGGWGQGGTGGGGAGLGGAVFLANGSSCTLSGSFSFSSNVATGGGTNPAFDQQHAASGSGIGPDIFLNQQAPLTLTFAPASNLTMALFSDSLSTSGGTINFNGPGNFILQGNATYTGTSQVNGAIFRAANATAFSAASSVSLANTAGVSLDLNNFAQTIAGLDGGGTTGGSVTLGSATLTLGDANNHSYGGSIGGTGGLTKQGAGIQAFSGSSDYSGATAINGGTFQAGADFVFSPNSIFTVANTAGVVLDLNNFNQSIKRMSGGGTTGGTLSLGSGTLVWGDLTPVTQSYGGPITGTGGLILNINNTMFFSNSNKTYSGDTVLNFTVLFANNANAFSPNSAITLSDFGSAIIFNDHDQVIGGLNGGAGGGGNVLMGNASVTLGNSADHSYTANLSGTGGLTKQGSGAQTFAGGSGSYGGSTTVNGGILRVGGNGAYPSGTALTLANTSGVAFDVNGFSQTVGSLAGGGLLGGDVTLGSGTLIFGNASNLTFAGAISGTGGLTKQGSGTQLFTNMNKTYGGTTAITGGTLQAGNASAFSSSSMVNLSGGTTLDLNNFDQTIGGLAGSGNVTMGSGSLTFGDSSNQTYGGVISGSGNLTKQGSGTETLSNTSNYNGSTTINVGILQLGTTNALPTTTTLTLANTAGVALDLNGNNQTVAILSGGGTTGGNVTSGSGGVLTFGNAVNQTFAGAVTGSAGLTKQGSSTQLFTNTNNNYSGTTTINVGILQAGAANVFSANSAVTMANTAGVSLDLNNFDQSIGGLDGGGTTGGTVTAGNGVLSFGDSSNHSFAGQITANNGIIKKGAGIQALTNPNTYGGSTTINAGILRSGAANAIPSTTSLILANTTGAAFDLNGFSQTVVTLSGGGSSGGNITLGSGTLTFGNGTNQTFGGSITGSGGLTKQGTGTQTISNTNTNYSGLTTITTGILQAGAANAFSSNSAVSLANTAGVALDLNGFSQIIGGLSGGGTTGGNVTLNGGTLTFGNSSSVTFAGVIQGAGGIVKQGSGTETLTNTNTYGGFTTINGGIIQKGSASAIPSGTSLILANTSGVAFDLNGFDQTVVVLSGGGGSGGNVTLGSGTLTFGDATNQSFGGAISGAGGLVKQGVGTQTFTNGNNNYNGSTTINAGVFQAGVASAFSPNSAFTLPNTAGVTLDLNNFSASIKSLAGGGTTGGSVTLGSGTLTFGDTTNQTFAGAISGTGGITKQGSGTQVFTNANKNYSGTTSVNAGTLQAGNATAFSSSSTVNLGGGNLDLNNIDQTVGGLSGSSGTVSLGTGTLTFGGNGSTTTFSGAITGSGGIIKNGGGTFSINGTSNNFSGATTVNAGGVTASASSLSTNSRIAWTSTGTFTNQGANTIPGISMTAGTLSVTSPLTLGGDNLTSTLSPSSMTVTGGIFKIGSGQLVIGNQTAANFNSTLTLTSGSINFPTSTTLLNLALVSFSATNPVTLQVDGSTRIGGITGGSSSAVLSVGTLLDMTVTTARTFAGQITGTGGIRFSNNLTLTNGSNNYSGTTTTSSSTGTLGTLTLGANNAFSPNSAVVNTGTVSLGTFSATVASISSTGAGGGGTLNTGTGTLTFGGDNSTQTYAGRITGSGNLVKTGTGVFLLTNATNINSGTTTINGGTFRAGVAAAFSPNSAIILGSASGVTLDLNGFNNSIPGLSGGGATSNGVVLGSGTLTFGGNNASTSFLGSITGTGGIIKQGTGTFTLSNSATAYFGATTISAGTLQAAGTNAFSKNSQVSLPTSTTLDLNGFNNEILSLVNGSLGTILLGSGTLTLGSDNTSFTFPGLLTGTGGLTKSGTGTFTVSNTSNMFSGALTVNAGILTIGASGALPTSSSLSVASGGTFKLNDFTHSTGAISGGGFVELGSANLTTNASTSTTFSGVISGTGGVTKTGTGVWTLTGSNSFQGNLIINGGTVSISPTNVNFPSLDSSVVVNSTATLKGNGGIFGTVTVNSGATISPGNSIGTITIGGSLFLDPNSTTLIEISPTANSEILVANSAVVDGTLFVTVDTGSYAAGTTYTIIRAAGLSGSLTGNFSSYSFSFPLDAVVNKVGNTIQIILNGSSNNNTTTVYVIPIPGLSGNELVTANYLNGLPSSFNNQLSAALNGLSGTALQKALQKITPSRLSFGTYVAQRGAVALNDLLSNRMSAQRLLSTTSKTEQTAAVTANKFLSQNGMRSRQSLSSFAKLCSVDSFASPPMRLADLDAPEESESDEYIFSDEFKPVPAVCECPKRDFSWSVWLDEFGNWSHQDTQLENPAFNAFTGGTLIGFDAKNAKESTVGVFAGFVRSTVNNDGSFGSQVVNNYLSGFYASIVHHRFFFEWALWAGYNHIESDRKISYTGFNEIAESTFSAWQLAPHFKFGMDFPIDSTNLTLKPFVALDCPVFIQEKYKEHGAGIFDMKVESETSAFLQFTVGLQTSEEVRFKGFSLIMQQGLEYLYNTSYGMGSVTASVIGAPTSFTTFSFQEGQSLGAATFDFLLKSDKNYFLNLNLSGQAGSGYAAAQVFGGLGYEF
ncbi:MAG: autotransporter-associated beta strand repeat-containing protein [Verrucomicrobia bacterium]|nr:autotransporter-associated beta strand repeat-containing protein [Verrucomicrobiota bacterium]